MEKNDLLEIADGLRLIEEGVMKIQGVMRAKNIKSLQDVAAELIPFFKADDDALTDSLIEHLEPIEEGLIKKESSVPERVDCLQPCGPGGRVGAGEQSDTAPDHGDKRGAAGSGTGVQT